MQLKTSRPLTLALLICFSGSLLVGGKTQSSRGMSAQDLSKMSLEEILNTFIVSGASKHDQATGEAPASVSIVTAEDIQRFGYRSLEDVLRSQRGFYSTYDRNYNYAGVRDFGRPGDYNTRVLILVNGQRTNDPVYDASSIGG